MSVSYTCPNPECGVTLKTPNPVQAGKSVKCPKCKQNFFPESEEAEAKPGPGTLKFADEPETKKKTAPKKKAADAANSGAKPPPPEVAPVKKPLDDDDDEESIRKGYGIIQETEEEIERAEKNKPTFTEVQDKFKKSARGPAQAQLVMPSNLMTLMGLIVIVLAIAGFIDGMWPLVFNDAPPGDEEFEEAVQQMALALLGFMWGALVCFGASQMQELASYTWSMVGSVLAMPLLVGIFAVVLLQKADVKAGFEEGDGGPDEDDEEELKKKKEEEEEDEEDDEDEDDDDDKPKKKAKAKR